jgi:hypothetical protein
LAKWDLISGLGFLCAQTDLTMAKVFSASKELAILLLILSSPVVAVTSVPLGF